MQMTEHKWDFLIGVFLSALFLSFLLFINEVSVEVPQTAHESASSNAITPRSFPDAVCLSLFCFSVGLVISSLLRIRADNANPNFSVESTPVDWLGLGTKAAAMGTLLLLYFVADWLGIVVGGFFFYLLFSLFTGERRVLRALLGATLTTVCLYYLFVELASVPLPLGILEGVF